MYETLLRLWIEGKLTEVQLHNATLKGWLTPEQEQQIISSQP